MIEIKATPGTEQQTVVAILSCLNRYWLNEKALPLISSFNHEVLQYCRSFAPEMPLGLLMHTWDDKWSKIASDLACYSVNLNRKIATSERIRAIKEQGYFLFVYVVNRRRQARKLFEQGVDAVFSDYPDLLGVIDNTPVKELTR